MWPPCWIELLIFVNAFFMLSCTNIDWASQTKCKIYGGRNFLNLDCSGQNLKEELENLQKNGIKLINRLEIHNSENLTLLNRDIFSNLTISEIEFSQNSIIEVKIYC